MFTNALPSELLDVAAAHDPDVYTATAYSSGYADMRDYEQLLAVFLLGDMGSSATYIAKLQSAVAASGGADIVGKTITSLTQAGTDGDKQAMINLRREEMDLANLHRFVKALITIGVQSVDSSVIILGAKSGVFPNAKLSEVVALLATVDPDAVAPTAHNSDWIDVSKWHGLLAVLQIGDLGAGTTVTAKFEQATTSGGSAKDVTGRATATIDQTTSPNPSNQAIKLDCLPEDLDIANGYRWVRLVVTVTDEDSPADSTSDIAAAVFGVNPRTGIASDQDLASVDEIVA